MPRPPRRSFPNRGIKFNTDAEGGRNTSRYYVYRNGLIRAKFADVDHEPPALHIRPRKNICYVPHHADVEEYGSHAMEVDGRIVRYSEAMARDSSWQRATYDKKPVDFYIGRRESGFHRGHDLIEDFHATLEGREVIRDELDHFVRRYFGSTTRSLRAGSPWNFPLARIADRITR